ncbi:uncharacterized protein LOC107885840 [Acyrthosiphon pisum]|uniref:Uncharacterized protein n=1 Tax=Acyrthosiphon pisum TaxID=7029 RepID=A0A8R2D8B2_ACYPI|nr:uncharacterized protein LOC107885840 [Acyrthosiphon pisum]|eukprot:XP_016665021.1 PREDICTED: uncharacterized protein LOC107885840 [Acyrthosiphon pisum]
MSNNSSPSTPVYGGDEYNRRLAEIHSQSPVFINMDEHDFFVYGEMTQSGDSGYSTNQSTQVENNDWHRAFSPIHPPATPSPPRLSQMENCQRSLTPVQPVLLEEASLDMFPPTTPIAYVLRVRNDLFPDLDSQSSVSHSTVEIPRVMLTPEYNMLFEGENMNTSHHSGEQTAEMDWSEDGNNEELISHMEAYEDDEELNRHMDEYEGF